MEIQRSVVPGPVREAIKAAVVNSHLTGFDAFNSLCLTIMGSIFAGEMTPEQADAAKPYCELLFSSIAAMTMRNDAAELRSIQQANDPAAMLMKRAAEGARRVRPTYMLTDDPESDTSGMGTLRPDGSVEPLFERELVSGEPVKRAWDVELQEIEPSRP